MGVVTVEPRRLQDHLGRVAGSFGMQLDGFPSASAEPFSLVAFVRLVLGFRIISSPVRR
jgi:hypothetical protein